MKFGVCRIVSRNVLVSGIVLLGGVSAWADEPQYGGELVYAKAGEQHTLFPGRNLSSQAQDVWLYGCENLVEMNEDGEIEPWLAREWSTSANGREVTFQLQEGVSFHDGTPFDAEAVAFVFNEAIEKDFLYANLLGTFEEARVDSEYTVTLQFERSPAALLQNLAYRSLCIFSPTAYLENGEEWMATNVVGTGPFIQKEYRKGEYILFERNPDYWQEGKPYLDSIRIIYVPDMAIRAAMLQSGEVDRTVLLNDFDIPRLEADANINVRIVPSTRQYYQVLNHLVHPLDNANVRRAFNYAIDKEGIVASVFAGRGAFVPTAPTLTEGVFGYQDMRNDGDATIFQYDPERAKELLRLSGYEDRDGDGFVEDVQGNKLELEMFSRRGARKGDYQTAQLVQSFLRDIGVDVSITLMESASFSSAISQSPTDAAYDMVMLSWGVPTADPDEPMLLFTYSKAWKPAGSNRMFYYSSEIDRITEAATSETDPDKRQDLIRQYMEQLLEDAPVIYLPTLALNLGSRSYVKGDRLLAIGNYPARFAWMDHEEKARQGISR